LHVSGTNFQVAVWRALLRIPAGAAATYSQIAEAVGAPRAARAAGAAIGANPVAFLIPCHRVIEQNGGLGGYRWGVERKRAMQLWERLRQPPADVTHASCRDIRKGPQ
jgi:AraC family transcriptional regulator of adaptative response/methylated-DNA-[protein]-cysteine methyltransferase